MSRPPARSRVPMRTRSRLLWAGALGAAGLAGLAIASCVPRAPEPAPPPRAAPQPTAPIVTRLPTPTYDDWMDAPATPGDWRYQANGPATQATFSNTPGPGPLTIVCDLATSRIGIARASSASGGASGPVQMRIRSESADRLVEASPQANGLVAEFAATDPILDALAFSKGRFAIEIAGAETLYLPAYPEVSRVIEDCRRGAL